MQRKYFLSLILLLALFLPAFWHGASARQVEECYLSRNGFLAGSSPDNLKNGIEYEKAGKREKLDALIEDGRVIRLKENTEIRVIERSVELKMLEIRFPDQTTPYWVMDDSLAPIKKDK